MPISREHRHVRAFLRLSLIMLCVLVGLPALGIGVLGIAGVLADSTYSHNVSLGLASIALAALIASTTIVWFVRDTRMRSRRSNTDPVM